jgi:hypothetical protein
VNLLQVAEEDRVGLGVIGALSLAQELVELRELTEIVIFLVLHLLQLHLKKIRLLLCSCHLLLYGLKFCFQSKELALVKGRYWGYDATTVALSDSKLLTL